MTHLLFADGSLLLIEASEEGASEISRILQVYEVGSGQIVNRDKLSIMFNKNTKTTAKNAVM